MKFHYKLSILQEIYCKIKYRNNNLFLKKKKKTKFHAKILPFILPSTNFQSSKSNNTVSPPFSLSFRLSFYHRKTSISSSNFFFLSLIPDYWLVRAVFQGWCTTAYCSPALVNHPVVCGPSIQVETHALPWAYILYIYKWCMRGTWGMHARARICIHGRLYYSVG